MTLHHPVSRLLAVAGMVFVATATPSLAQEGPDDTSPATTAETTTTTAAPDTTPAPIPQDVTVPEAPASTAPPDTGSSPTSPGTSRRSTTTESPPDTEATTESTESEQVVEAPAAAEIEPQAAVDGPTGPGNVDCPAGLTTLKVEPVVGGNHTDGTLNVTLSIVDTAQGQTFNWTSNIGVDVVIAKGGNDSNVYTYNPESTGDTGLHAPVNDNNNTYFDLSHITFCYDADNGTTTTTTAPGNPTSTTTTSTTQPTTTTTESTTTTSTTAPSTTTTSTTAPPTTSPPSTEPPTTSPPTTPHPFGSAVTPAELTTTGQLPTTGTDTGTYVAIGLALLALGAGITFAARKAAP